MEVLAYAYSFIGGGGADRDNGNENNHGSNSGNDNDSGRSNRDSATSDSTISPSVPRLLQSVAPVGGAGVTVSYTLTSQWPGVTSASLAATLQVIREYNDAIHIIERRILKDKP